MKFTKENILNQMNNWWTSKSSWNDIKREIEKMEEPEISNAMQAYDWLKRGEVIHDLDGVRYRLENGILQRLNIYGIWENHTILLQKLFESKWQLYEEPKYKEITAEEALTDFALNGVNDKIVCLFDDKEIYITEIKRKDVFLDVKNYNVYSNSAKNKAISRKKIQDFKWRIYEEQSND